MALNGTYTARRGQSFYDICLQTYLDLNQLYKLAADNKVNNIFQPEYTGQVFTFDKSLIKDTDIINENTVNKIFYVTSSGVFGSFDDSFDDSFD